MTDRLERASVHVGWPCAIGRRRQVRMLTRAETIVVYVAQKRPTALANVPITMSRAVYLSTYLRRLVVGTFSVQLGRR